MTQLFRKRSNAIASGTLLGVSGLLAGTFVFWTVYKWSDWETDVNVPYSQPVPFSHQHHVAGLGIDCRYCHTSVETTAFAGLPPTHTCMTCHSQIWQQSPMLQPVRDSYASGQPIRWNRVHRLPKFVYFNHSIHVNKGIGCTSCHAAVEKMPLMWKSTPFYMKDCLACHREPEKYIRPQSEVFHVDWVAPRNQLELGRRLVAEYRIPKQRLTDCYICHR